MKHYLTGDLVLKEAWNPQTEALDVSLKNTEIAISIKAEEGDSVLTIAPSMTLAEGEHSCAGMKTICKFGTATISVSPDIQGDTWHEIATVDLTPREICAMRIKIVGTGKVVIRG